MATDTLRQAGKLLHKTKRDTEYAIKRTTRNFPLVDKLRDSFDTTHPFVMEFRTFNSDDSVEVTLTFTEAFEHTG